MYRKLVLNTDSWHLCPLLLGGSGDCPSGAAHWSTLPETRGLLSITLMSFVRNRNCPWSHSQGVGTKVGKCDF